MKTNKTYIRFIENQVQIGTNYNSSWKGKMKYNLNDRQVNLLRKYIIFGDLADLGHFLNYRSDEKNALLIVVELLWCFSKNKSIKVVADDRYAERLSKKGIEEINKMLDKARKSGQSGEDLKND